MSRVAVVGGGVMGLAAAWRLAERDHEVTLYETRSIGHDGGSSHGATRIYRTAYDHPIYVRMARAALPLWRELEPHAGALLRVTGGIDLGPAAALRACADAMEAGGAEAHLLAPAEIAERFDWIQAPAEGLYSPDAAVLNAASTLTALAGRARAAGATIAEGARAQIRSDDGREVTIDGPDGIERFDSCVLAAGAWIGALSPVRFPVTVTEEHTFYAESPATAPVIWRGERFFYTVPSFDGSGPMKAGEHGVGTAVNPDDERGRADPARAGHLRTWLGEVIPRAGALTGGDRCLYTTTPDEHFVIERAGGVVIASACSGHGFKFAPLIGETLACLATGIEPPIDITPFAAGRF